MIRASTLLLRGFPIMSTTAVAPATTTMAEYVDKFIGEVAPGEEFTHGDVRICIERILSRQLSNHEKRFISFELEIRVADKRLEPKQGEGKKYTMYQKPLPKLAPVVAASVAGRLPLEVRKAKVRELFRHLREIMANDQFTWYPNGEYEGRRADFFNGVGLTIGRNAVDPNDVRWELLNLKQAGIIFTRETARQSIFWRWNTVNSLDFPDVMESIIHMAATRVPKHNDNRPV